MSKDYYVGLDIGTSSVGFAVTDTEYNIVRKKGKDFWGVRLFDEANTAAERRAARTSRRRLQRQKMRVGYLRKIFEPEIAKIDPGFIQRLNDSKFFEEDKQEKQPFALFADKKLTDKEYFEKYPTIFHLRKELIKSDKPHDIRFVYLALLNIFKHRGHFLNETLKEGEVGDLNELFKELEDCSKNVFYQEDGDDEIKEGGWTFLETDKIKEILNNNSYTNSEKHDELLKLLLVDKKTEKSKSEVLRLICGLTGKLTLIFNNEDERFNDENKEIHAISFRDQNYEEKEEKIREAISPDEFLLLSILKEIHDSALLSQILSGSKYISFSKVDQYEKHKSDLKLLKNVFKNYLSKDEYNSFFRTMEDNSYSAYVGSVNYKNNKIRRGAKYTDFFPKLKKIVTELYENHKNDGQLIRILSDIEKDNFLPKQRTVSNGVVPYQCYITELKQILENASKYLPFLKQKDESGKTAEERLIEIFKFRIPYYIGPLKKINNSNGWVIRKDESGTVYPWNFNDKIDVEATSEKFIKNLINHCTYMSGEYVMPKNSLLYEKYKVLNELNNLKVNETKITADLKQKIYIELFRNRGKRVTNKLLVTFLKQEGVLKAEDTEDCISGYDKALGGFVNTLSNYHKFAEIFRVKKLTDDQVKLAENIIYYSTIYGDSKEFLRNRIIESSGGMLDQSQINRILGIKFKDWGSFSRKFLETGGVDIRTGEKLTIIQRMWNENLNLQQILCSDYTYIDEISPERIDKDLNEFQYSDLEDTYLSAPVKRMVWQTIKIMKEIVSIMGYEPKHVFIEMTRSTGEKNLRKDSRKKKLQELYKKCKDDYGKMLAKKLDRVKDEDMKIKKLYLYYMQKGKCMYSGESIDLDKLMDDNLYDIDHIYPRHYIKDDSLENNLVLVKSVLNRDKTDSYPIEENIRKSQNALWHMLKDEGFITAEKFRRLTRNTGFGDEELSGFIQRQLVETGQGTKEVSRILSNVLGQDNNNSHKVIYVKAENVSYFRNFYGLYKSRIVNDFHHARDAYLNVIVGNAYFIKFTLDPKNFISEFRKNSKENQYHMYNMYNYIIRRGDVIAWDPKKDIETVNKYAYKNSPMVTKRVEEIHGALFDLMPISANKIKKSSIGGFLALKTSIENVNLEPEKYGGYNKVSGTYFFLVEHTVEEKNKKKRIRTIENLPLYLKEKLKSDSDLVEYCKQLGYEEPNIRITKIPMNSLLKVNGFSNYLTGRSLGRLITPCAEQLHLDKKMEIYTKAISNAVEGKYSNEYLEKMSKSNETVKGKNKNLKDSLPRIDKSTNIKMFSILCAKYLDGKFSRKPNSIGNTLKNGKDKFEKLDLQGQSQVLYNILSLPSNNSGIDLKLIGGSANAGVATINKKLDSGCEYKLINYSITGINSIEIDLQTV